MTYVCLVLAVAFEVGWALAMKLSQGFTRPKFVVATIVMYLLSVVFLALATKHMDVGVGYAIWAGSGVALIAIAGIVYFHEPVTAAKVIALALIVSGIALLQVAGGGH
jgi:quaternary ammonium compound-resistance protein SugE